MQDLMQQCGWGWAPISWEAIAGFSAVVAACVVAALQMDISKRQAALQELGHRAVVFDRRWQVYQETREALRVFMFEKNPEAQHSAMMAFYETVSRSRFLFNDTVQAHLEDVRDAMNELWQTTVVGKRARNSERQNELLDERAVETRRWLNSLWFSLPPLFENDLQLGGDLNKEIISWQPAPRPAREHPDWAKTQRDYEAASRTANEGNG